MGTQVTESGRRDTLLQAPADIYFCDNGADTQKRSRRDFAPEKKFAIQRLHKLDTRWNLIILFHFLIWLSAAALALRSRSLILDIPLYLVGGLSLSTLSVLGHESAHNLFTRKQAIDRWLGFLCGIPVLFSVAGYRIMHPLHHKFLHTQDDPDDIENASDNPAFLRFAYIFVFIAGVYLYLVTVPVNAIRKGTPKERSEVIIEWIAMAALALAAGVLLPARFLLKGWLYPLLVAGQVANLRGLAEHGLTTGGNEFTDTRTVATSPFLSFMMCNINYHLEHHLYPGIPWYNLPRLHTLLQDDFVAAGSSVYSSYAEFLRDVFHALRSGVHPGARLIPGHIREQVCL